MIQGMHHVSMKCSNAEEYAAVRAFYTELLRIPVLTEWETGILLDTGAGIVEIFQDETAEKLGQGVIRHFAFAVEDVEACVAAVSTIYSSTVRLIFPRFFCISFVLALYTLLLNETFHRLFQFNAEEVYYIFFR